MRYFATFLVSLLMSFGVAWAQSDGEIVEIELARNYLETLYDFDFENLRQKMADDFVFDDQTAVAFDGKGFHQEGKGAAIEFFEASSESTLDAALDIDSVFHSGGQVVFVLTYKSTVSGDAVGIEKPTVEIEVPAVTVITVADRLIQKHVDYIDYPLLLSQISRLND